MKDPIYISKKYSVKKSDIQGKGVFALKNLEKGELVGIAAWLQNLQRTELGKHLNHQNKHNAAIKSENNILNIYTNSAINKGDEITVNYKKGPNYIDKDVTGFKEK